MKGLFGELFDFNYGGNTGVLEKAVGITFLHDILREDNKSGRTVFELSGLDSDELEFMGAEKRREVLKDAGLNPDEYDF